MRRLFLLLFCFLLLTNVPLLYAQTPTILPSGVETAVDGLLLPGVTCGVPNDPDPGKAKCCVPKKENSFASMQSFLWYVPLVGDFFSGIQNRYDKIQDLSDGMSPCIEPGVPSTKNNLADPSCICVAEETSTHSAALNNLCSKYFLLSPNSSEAQKCSRCMFEKGGFYTAIGCIPLNLSSFITDYILNIGIGIAGGVALLCIFYSAFRMQTSMGNAEAIKKAQENLTACITGLIIIIFSVLILKIIGVSVLRIPL